MTYDIPGHQQLIINTIILDLNGTLSVGGAVPEGVRAKIDQLREKGLELVLFTGNTRGDAQDLADGLGISWRQAATAEEKRQLASEYDPATCATIGNGRIDLELTESVALGIVTLQAEGVHTKTLLAADIVVPNILDAVDLFIDAHRLIATLRS